MEAQFAKFLKVIDCETAEPEGVRSSTREFTQAPRQKKIFGRRGEDVENQTRGGSPNDEENLPFGHLRDFMADPLVAKKRK